MASGSSTKRRAPRGENSNVGKTAAQPIYLMKRITFVAFVCISLVVLSAGCNRNALTGSKLTLNNYNSVTNGMSKAQVERIMGPPTTSETKDMLIFKKTTYRYEEGPKFALFTFKNDELDTKDGNLATP
jgi:hypothetical protein